MNCKFTLVIRPVLVFMIISLILFSVSACSMSDSYGSVTNRDVINFREFYLDAGEVGLKTWTQGTVFVRGDLEHPDDITVQIVMDVEIDPDDWSGVGVIFPEGWRVTGCTSSLVEINEPYYANLVTVLTRGAPENGGESWVVAGEVRYSGGESLGDLEGTVIIEADYVLKGKATPETLKLNISCGSEKDYIMHPVSLDLTIPLLEDFRPSRVENSY